MTRFLLTLLCFLSASAMAQQTYPTDGAIKPGPEWADDDKLAIWLFLVPDQEAFLAEWKAQTYSSTITRIDKVEAGGQVVGTLVFSGCTAGPDGKCNLTADFRLIAADGTTKGQLRGSLLWNGAPPDTRVFYPGLQTMVVRSPRTAPEGPYRIEATVYDHNAGTSLTAWDSFTQLRSGD